MSTKSQHQARYRKLPAFLASLRNDAGLTQRQLGEALGRPQSWVFKSESGIRRVDATEFIEWAEACGIDPGEACNRLRALLPGKRPRGRG